MSLKDKLEIGLKPDAPYRRDNLPEMQQDDEACIEGATPGTAEPVEKARAECDANSTTPAIKKKLEKPAHEKSR